MGHASDRRCNFERKARRGGLGGGSQRDRFFYLQLCDGPQSRSRDDGDGLRFPDRCVDYIIECYGVRRLFADLDAGLAYTRSTLVDSILTYVTTEGFAQTFERYESPFRSALEFRQRYLLDSLKNGRQVSC